MVTEDKNAIDEQLLEVFRRRFKQTADIIVSELDYLFTSIGLRQLRFLDDDKDKYKKRMQLKKLFLDITNEAAEKNPTAEFIFSPALFDYYIDSFDYNEGENLMAFWMLQMWEEVKIPNANKGKAISLRAFLTAVLCIISFPASEAMCEKAFSAIKSIITDLNTTMKSDLYHALAIIKTYNFMVREFISIN